MRIVIRLFASLREGRFRTMEWELPEGSKTADVIQGLEMRPRDVSIILVNGRTATSDRALKDGDTLSLLPPMGGG